MGAFSSSIQANSAKILETVNNQCYDIAFELFNYVINLTPSPEMRAADGRALFAKGLLINQWYPVDGPSFSGEFNSSTSDDGADSRDRLTQTVLGSSFEGKDGTVTMTNNTPYVMLAEDTGWARTPAYHMAALSIQAIAAKYK